jgi:hypothetical protein
MRGIWLDSVDVLGRFQDRKAQREAIYALATDMIAQGDTSAPTILAMGEIAARLQEDQHFSRAQYATRFQRFAQPSVQRRMARLKRPVTTPTQAASTASRGRVR